MDAFDVPILKKIYNLYKELNGLRVRVPKQDRYTLWERCEKTNLEVLELILLAAQRQKPDKYRALEMASAKLNVLRMLIRLTKDVKAIDTKRYLALELQIDEIGRMLGGWMKSISPPPPEFRHFFPTCSERAPNWMPFAIIKE
jgi:hypothetical protein